MSLRTALLVFTLALAPLAGLSSLCRADTPVRDAGIGETLRLMEGQRYPDAIPVAQTLVQGSQDGYSYCSRGALALCIGAAAQAQSDFSTASHLIAADALPYYGLGLCALMTHDPQNAARQFALARDRATEADLPAINTGAAAADAVSGRRRQALDELSAPGPPAAMELKAVLLEYTDRSQSRTLLETLLTAGEVNGVTRVTEPAGLRLLCATDGSMPALEPDVSEPLFQQIYGDRLASLESPAGAAVLSGIVTLKTRLGGGRDSHMVSLAVDGRTIGMNNSPPMEFQWDTRESTNGSHQLLFSEINENGGVVATDSRTVSVANGDSSGDDTTSPLPEPLRTRLWAVLAINPSFKVAQYELAQECQAASDPSGYAEHILAAAALDPSYRQVHRKVGPLFAGRIPAAYPVPSTLHIPSSLGLSAGEGTKAGFWAGSSRIREIALTFDDGPVPGPANALLAALEKAHACGTFFVVGMRAVAAPECLHRMHTDGDAVEDHSYTHPNLDQVLPIHMTEEILRTAVVIRSITGVWPEFLRPPGGNTNPLVLMTARACGMGGAFWTVDAWPAEESGSAQAVTRLILGEARPGAIMLMHDGADATTAAIPMIVSGLRAAGYKLVTLPQLAADALTHRG